MSIVLFCSSGVIGFVFKSLCWIYVGGFEHITVISIPALGHGKLTPDHSGVVL